MEEWLQYVLIAAALVLATSLFLRSNKGGATPGKAPAATAKKPEVVPVKPKKEFYTLEEVARHASSDDCWLIIEDKVYDVTSYVDEHPGGDAILNNAGGDSTAGFLGSQHPIERVREMIEEFYIGKLRR